jgi:hypothetical protein
VFRFPAALLLGLAIAGPLPAAEPSVARVSAFADGSLLLNGKPSDLKGIAVEFARLQKLDGEVWYHRENPQAEPHPNAVAVIELVMKHRLRISLSSKPDFSDTVDRDGRSRPRKP